MRKSHLAATQAPSVKVAWSSSQPPTDLEWSFFLQSLLALCIKGASFKFHPGNTWGTGVWTSKSSSTLPFAEERSGRIPFERVSSSSFLQHLHSEGHTHKTGHASYFKIKYQIQLFFFQFFILFSGDQVRHSQDFNQIHTIILSHIW